jgi:hypothetical protein
VTVPQVVEAIRAGLDPAATSEERSSALVALAEVEEALHAGMRLALKVSADRVIQGARR